MRFFLQAFCDLHIIWSKKSILLMSHEYNQNEILEVEKMENNHNMQNEINEKQKEHDKFNSVTQKSTPENQNQTHNVRQEGISKINQNR